MALGERLRDDLTRAMKARDQGRVSCLRLVLTAVKNRRVEKCAELEDIEIEAVISSLVRKGKDAAEEFAKAGRQDLADKETGELEILYEYLPRQLTPDQVEEIVRAVIEELAASGMKDMGRVMKAAMGRMAGRAQGGDVKVIVARLLG